MISTASRMPRVPFSNTRSSKCSIRASLAPSTITLMPWFTMRSRSRPRKFTSLYSLYSGSSLSMKGTPILAKCSRASASLASRLGSFSSAAKMVSTLCRSALVARLFNNSLAIRSGSSLITLLVARSAMPAF